MENALIFCRMAPKFNKTGGAWRPTPIKPGRPHTADHAQDLWNTRLETMTRVHKFKLKSYPNFFAHLRRLVTIFALLLFLPAVHAEPPSADPLVLLVQPTLSVDRTKQTFQPLTDFIATATGRRCVVHATDNFFTYWGIVRDPSGYDLVLDAAHFTDYRVRKLGFHVLVKAPETVGYSLVVAKGRRVFDPIELAGKRIATLGAPSIGAVHLSAMFPNPARQPVLVEVPDAENGLELVLAQEVDAAMLLTPLVSQRLAQGTGIVLVTSTEPIPDVALSASGALDPKLHERIRNALLRADHNPKGKKMLQAIGIPGFAPAASETYANQANLLKKYWGY